MRLRELLLLLPTVRGVSAIARLPDCAKASGFPKQRTRCRRGGPAGRHRSLGRGGKGGRPCVDCWGCGGKRGTRRRRRVGIAEEGLHVGEQQLASAVRQHQREVGQIAQMRANFGGSGDSHHPVRCVRQLALDDAFVLELGRGDGEAGTRSGALHLCGRGETRQSQQGRRKQGRQTDRELSHLQSKLCKERMGPERGAAAQSIRARREAFQLTSTGLHPGPCPLIWPCPISPSLSKISSSLLICMCPAGAASCESEGGSDSPLAG